METSENSESAPSASQPSIPGGVHPVPLASPEPSTISGMELTSAIEATPRPSAAPSAASLAAAPVAAAPPAVTSEDLPPGTTSTEAPPVIPRPWYVAVGAERTGPLSIAEVRELVSEAKVTEMSLAWKKGMADWTPAGEIPELRAVLTSQQSAVEAAAHAMSEFGHTLREKSRTIPHEAFFAAAAAMMFFMLLFSAFEATYTRWFVILPVAALAVLSLLGERGLFTRDKMRPFTIITKVALGIVIVLFLIDYIRVSGIAHQAVEVAGKDQNFRRTLGLD